MEQASQGETVCNYDAINQPTTTLWSTVSCEFKKLGQLRKPELNIITQ